MKVLLTGATGFLGGRLCLALLAEGYSVRALVRRSSDLSSLRPTAGEADLAHGLELVYGDVTDLESLVKACDGCQALFHVAALVEAWLPDPSKFYTVNVRGLENVLNAFAKTETMKKLIYTSSFFAIGPTDGGSVADETQMHQGKSFCTEYEKSKFIADGIALKAAESGVPIVILYPGVIYGHGKLTAGNVLARILIERFNWRLPGYMGNGHDINSFCHVDDVVNGHIAALHKGKLGERYLLSGENASFVQIFDMAAAITKTSKPFFHIPLWMIEIYGWILVFVSRITGTLPLMSYPTVRVLRRQWAYSCDKARRELGYNPRSLNEGLTEMLSWLKSLKQIKY
ncbi:NAD(P)-binding Rossmann-fold superfamily protein [Rhynchospora pubera]|uniref:NAD(P)-binding Rossmann-fold superfamily protein n=1 Tax=Rhynchospora pubera TaxID=906938 RepID=A0AAV8DIH5_9POAL|nr:NAD(P)-binding Rossmann-fold superfamily protein [Rhynchospora pubera]